MTFFRLALEEGAEDLFAPIIAPANAKTRVKSISISELKPRLERISEGRRTSKAKEMPDKSP